MTSRIRTRTGLLTAVARAGATRIAATGAVVAVIGSTVGAGAAGAVTISPAGTSFTAPGSITVALPVTFGIPVTCSLTLTGITSSDGASALITNAIAGGPNPLCAVPTLTGLPWTLTPTSTSTGQVSTVTFTALGATCGPATLSGSFDNMTGTLSAVDQPLPGNCRVTRLSVVPVPAFTLS